MSFFQNLFGSAAPAPAPEVKPAEPTPPVAATPEPAKSPLDEYSKLWETKSNEEEPKTAIINADPTKVMEAASAIDFTKLVSNEDMQIIAQGGEGAQRAMLAAMNKMAQATYAQSALTANKIIEATLAKYEDTVQARIAEGIRKNDVSREVRSANPQYNHPAVRPIIEAIENSMTANNPNATPAEIKASVNAFLNTFSGIAAPAPSSAPAKQSQPQQDNNFDWVKFINS